MQEPSRASFSCEAIAKREYHAHDAQDELMQALRYLEPCCCM